MSAPLREGLSLRDLKKSYLQGSERRMVLDGLDLDVAPGASVAIQGPSGCGKSTLLNLIGALDRPDHGIVFLNGSEAVTAARDPGYRYRNQAIGFVFQDHLLLPELTALENVLLPTLPCHRAQELRPRAKELLGAVGLAKRDDAFPARLSGGERQRVALARALILAPKVLLCDEPTGNLDPAAAGAVGDLILRLARERKACIVVVTHDRGFAERFDSIQELRDGRLTALEASP